MSIPGSASPLLLASTAAAPTGAQVSRSLRFNSADSAYLSRACTAPATSWTWSAWIKRSILNDYQFLFVPVMAGYPVGLNFNNDHRLRWYDTDGVSNFNYYSTAVFRDVSAWYHIVMRVSAGAFTIYVNNTSHITGSLSSALQSGTWYQGSTYSGSPLYGFNGYLANNHFIDGQALTPASFAETDATTGAWNPKAYSGSYGTNGFNLLFADNSSNTASTLGKDTSGLSNNWTPNNLSVTAGAGNDSLVDSPTNYGTDTGVGGEVRGNYATWNPLINSTNLTNGNLSVVQPSSTAGYRSSTIGMPSGKWYWEINIVKYANTVFGVIKNPNNFIESSDGMGWRTAGGFFTTSGSVAGSLSVTAGDLLGLAFNADTAALSFYKNGSFVITITSSADVGKTWFAASQDSGGGNSDHDVNFGQRAFAYTAPSGFKALCTQNLPTPLVTKSNTVFDVKLWTGDGSSTRAITGLEFNPDFVWIKNRNQAGIYHNLFDKVRDSGKTLFSNTTDSEVTNSAYGYLSSFDSNGFSLSAGGSGSDNVNVNTWTYAGWCWDAGTSTVSNTQGSITSQVRANPTAGFSVVTWTSPAAAHTIGHGLGAAPSFIIAKTRNTSSYWWIYHQSLGAAYSLNFDTAAANNTYNAWNGTSPTSSVLSMGFAAVYDWVAYAFSPVVGYSNFGSYTGGGSSGRFVYTGFRPKLIWVKNYNDGSYPTYTGWYMWDSVRGAYNYNQSNLNANSSNIEGIRNTGGSISTIGVDILSNGFCLRGPDDADTNWGSGQYIYCAWAEMPFNYSRAR